MAKTNRGTKGNAATAAATPGEKSTAKLHEYRVMR